MINILIALIQIIATIFMVKMLEEGNKFAKYEINIHTLPIIGIVGSIYTIMIWFSLNYLFWYLCLGIPFVIFIGISAYLGIREEREKVIPLLILTSIFFFPQIMILLLFIYSKLDAFNLEK